MKSTLSICVIFMRAVTVCLYIQSFGVLGRRMDRLLTPARRIFSSGRSKPRQMTIPVSLPLDSQTSLWSFTAPFNAPPEVKKPGWNRPSPGDDAINNAVSGSSAPLVYSQRRPIGLYYNTR